MYSISFVANKSFILKNGVEICSKTLENNLNVSKPLACKMLLNTKFFKTATTKNKRKKFSKRKCSYLTSKIRLNKY